MYETSKFPKPREELRDDIIRRITAILREAGIPGTVEPYGSFVSGFATSCSDIDVTILVGDDIDPRSVLPTLIPCIESAPGFLYVSRVFASKNQLIKFTDAQTDTDIELTVNNILGIRNSLLLRAYQDYDDRIVQYARRVKDWCRHFDLVGSQDGCINSYGWMLMAIHYIIKKNVVCNLQILAEATGVPRMFVKNCKTLYGEEDEWDTRFWEDKSQLPKSKNSETVEELFSGFIEYYSTFDWDKNAVSIRTALPNVPEEALKRELCARECKEYPWYIEDPFELKHNLAANTTEHGRGRIAAALQAERENPGSFRAETPPQRRKYFLRATIGEQVAPDSLLDAFVSKDLVRLHYPKPKIEGREGALYKPVFFEFASATGIKKALTLNESSIDSCELRLLKSTRSSVAHEISQWSYEEYDAAKYANATNQRRDLDRSKDMSLRIRVISCESADRSDGLYGSRNGDEHAFSSEVFRHAHTTSGYAGGYGAHSNRATRTLKGYDGSPVRKDMRKHDAGSPPNARLGASRTASRTAPRTSTQIWLDNETPPAASAAPTWADFFAHSYVPTNEEAQRSAPSVASLDIHEAQQTVEVDSATTQSDTATSTSVLSTAEDSEIDAQARQRGKPLSEKAHEEDRPQEGGADGAQEKKDNRDEAIYKGTLKEAAQPSALFSSRHAVLGSRERLPRKADHADNGWQGGRWARGGWNDKKGDESNGWKHSAQKSSWNSDWEKRSHSNSWNARGDQWVNDDGNGWKQKTPDAQDRSNYWNDSGWNAEWNNDGGSRKLPQPAKSSTWPQHKSAWSSKTDGWKSDAGSKQW